MVGKKKVLSEIILKSGLHRILSPVSPARLTVLNYHRISKSGCVEACLFDDEVFSSDDESFRRNLKWLKSRYSIISEGELIDSLNGGKQIPNDSVLITFDDGYRDNFELAFPILKDLEIPAIFFIPTDSIDQGSLGWWDLIAFIVKKTSLVEFSWLGSQFKMAVGSRVLTQQLQEKIKTTGALEVDEQILALAKICGVDLPSRDRCAQELMTWDQVIEVSCSGLVSIGSHTRSHRVLSTLGVVEQQKELEYSKWFLESKTGVPIRSIAYPVGGYAHFNIETLDIARQCGYEIGFSFQTGINLLGQINRYDIHRIPGDLELSMMCAALSLPSVFAQRKSDPSGPLPVRDF